MKAALISRSIIIQGLCEPHKTEGLIGSGSQCSWVTKVCVGSQLLGRASLDRDKSPATILREEKPVEGWRSVVKSMMYIHIYIYVRTYSYMYICMCTHVFVYACKDMRTRAFCLGTMKKVHLLSECVYTCLPACHVASVNPPALGAVGHKGAKPGQEETRKTCRDCSRLLAALWAMHPSCHFLRQVVEADTCCWSTGNGLASGLDYVQCACLCFLLARSKIRDGGPVTEAMQKKAQRLASLSLASLNLACYMHPTTRHLCLASSPDVQRLR